MFWCGEELWKNTWTYCRIACLRCSKNVLRTSSIEEKYKWQFLSPNNLMLNFFRRSRVAIFFCVCLTLCRFLLSEFERKCTCSTATSLCSKWMKSWNTISCVGSRLQRVLSDACVCPELFLSALQCGTSYNFHLLKNRCCPRKLISISESFQLQARLVCEKRIALVESMLRSVLFHQFL